MHECFTYSKHLLYADDKKIFLKINTIEDCHKLQNDLDKLTEYYKCNRISVNIDKCTVITYNRKPRPICHTYKINNQIIKRVSDVRDLGVHLESKMLFNKHIDIAVSKAYWNLGFVFRVCKPFNDISCIKAVYFAYVRSILEFASIIWNPHYTVYKNDIERIQMKFIKYINYKKKVNFPSYAEACAFHGIETLENRRKMLDMAFLHDIVNSTLDCSPLTSLISMVVPRRPPRHELYGVFYVPGSKTNYGSNEYISRVTKYYNKNFSSVDIYSMSKKRFKNEVMKRINARNCFD